MIQIFGILIISIVSALLLVWLLIVGFQILSPADVLALGGRFGHFESGYDIFFTFAVPLVLVLAFAVMAFSFILAAKIE